MKKLFYSSLFILLLAQSSCTMMIKGIAKNVINKYDDYKELNVSDFQLVDKRGKQQSFSALYAGKTVYFYVWSTLSNRPSGEKDINYTELKKRFSVYPDVIFADIYIGSDQQAWIGDGQSTAGTDQQFLLRTPASTAFISSLKGAATVPFIIGKDGQMLAFKGPKPQDKMVVDYVLYEARNGVDGTTSGRKLVKGVNSNQRFKTKELRNWYTNHFKASLEDKLSFSISTTE